MEVVRKGKRGTEEEALNIYRKLREELQLPIYVDEDTAVIDFHWAIVHRLHSVEGDVNYSKEQGAPGVLEEGRS
jgi:hypothetical protein